jgi:hypothetical protein
VALEAVACEARLGSVEDMDQAVRAAGNQVEELPVDLEEHQVLVLALVELESPVRAAIAPLGQ